jgi:hypothetical protein
MNRSLLGAMVMTMAAGCLPRGQAPAGEHLLAGRAPLGLQFLRGRTTSPPLWLLIWQDRDDRQGADLFVAEVTGTGATGAPRRIAERIDAAGSAACQDFNRRACGFALDDRDRTLLRPWLAVPPGDLPSNREPRPVLRVNLATGETEDLGLALGSEVLRSSSSNRFLLVESADRIRVAESDGRTTTLEHATSPAFVGDNLFYMVPPDPSLAPGGRGLAQVLWLLPTEGPARPIRESVQAFAERSIAGAPVILITYRRPGDTDLAWSVLDPVTLVETPLPVPAGPGARNFLDFSPDGRRFVFATHTSRDAPIVTFVDRESQASETVEIPSSASVRPNVVWRPGRDEAWITGDSLLVWRPGGPVTPVMRTPLEYERRPRDTPSLFTEDGAHWFSVERDPSSALQSVYLGPADDPEATRMRLTPAGTGSIRHWALPDGRLVVEAWTTDVMRSDLYVVDPRAGTQRAVGSGGSVVAAGHSRLLAQLHWLKSGGSGDLTLIDVDTGAPELLAENVYGFALEPSGPDRLAGGVHVAFAVHSRLASPFDGVWVAALP